ncbi:hypothetical protein [Janthinobacterium sp. B9-8]|uniref:hypothetical protein n=1 Tax=Janthinobacterium sp. B9-8 TaxID=1236179 RepID=UPI00061D3368|nr:hypothetical protein [Janthinobacterium sp. B9-8]AMC35204.1 hypothetical protein VN23_11560 [Janthinobacterium sp. B9-8]
MTDTTVTHRLTPIVIELSTPYQVKGVPIRYQSLWLLVRMVYAQQVEKHPLTAATIRANFPKAQAIRMLISRAFAEFSRIQITVGWGHDQQQDTSLLSPSQRSRGPFWLTIASLECLEFTQHGVKLAPVSLASFLGLQASSLPRMGMIGERKGVDYVMQDMRFWQHLTQGMREGHDGFARPARSRDSEPFFLAQQCAHDDFQQALALMKASLAWRRSDLVSESKQALSRFEHIIAVGQLASARPTFAAMAQIVHAWDRYTHSDIEAARVLLLQLEASATLGPVVRYNPRVRFEYLNLSALLYKYDAMSEGGALRQESADAALQALSYALEAACEADSIDAVQHVAANIGWCLWLFRQLNLLDQPLAAVQTQAMRWLGLSEWICDRFGVGSASAWNTIFILRIARGNCPPEGAASLEAFRLQQPLPLTAAAAALQPFSAPFAPSKGFSNWFSWAQFSLEEYDSGRVNFPPLQLANLLLEAAWFCVFEQGACLTAYQIVERLRALLLELRPGERIFFRDALASVPLP